MLLRTAPWWQLADAEDYCLLGFFKFDCGMALDECWGLRQKAITINFIRLAY